MNQLLILSRDADKYASLIKQAGLAHIEFSALQKVPEKSLSFSKFNIVLGEPDLIRQVLPDLKALQWAQSTWAGIRPLAAKGCRRDYTLTGVKDVFGPIMSEFVFCYLLMHERKVLKKYASQQKRRWDPAVPGRLAGKTIGILGVGSIGQEIAKTAKFFSMRTKGYARKPISCEFIDDGFCAPMRLENFVRDLDYLVSVLPDTPETTGILGRQVFKAMKPDTVLINAGRGTVLQENDLIEALASKEISGAVLDVFQEEPLPESHPFWRTPGIIITSHTAAMSRPEDIARIFIENYQSFQSGTPLKYEINFNRGY